MPQVKTPDDARKHAEFKAKMALIEENQEWTKNTDDDLPGLKEKIGIQEDIDNERRKKARNKIVKKPKQKLIKINVCLYQDQFDYVQSVVEAKNMTFTNVIREIIQKEIDQA